MNLPTIQVPGHTHYITQVSHSHLTVSSLTPDLLSSVYYFLHSYGKVEKNDILRLFISTLRTTILTLLV